MLNWPGVGPPIRNARRLPSESRPRSEIAIRVPANGSPLGTIISDSRPLLWGKVRTRGGVATTYVDAATTQRLAAVAHGANATMFMMFLSGFAATLSRYARQGDMLLGTQVTDRTHACVRSPAAGI